MALNATIWNFDINLSDMDRNVYETLSLRMAQQPSETIDYMLTRLLAYCMEWQEGIDFGQTVGSTSSGHEEAAVWARDYTGTIKLWVEVGMPDPEKLHRASKAAERAIIYTHRDPDMLRRNLAGKTIYRAEAIEIVSFDRSFLSQLAQKLDRRSKFDLSITEGQLYLSIGNDTLESKPERLPVSTV